MDMPPRARLRQIIRMPCATRLPGKNLLKASPKTTAHSRTVRSGQARRKYRPGLSPRYDQPSHGLPIPASSRTAAITGMLVRRARGHNVYSCDYGVDGSHPEFSDILFITPLSPGPFPACRFMENDENPHSTACLSEAVGKTVGIGRKAGVVATAIDCKSYIQE
ncbi:hypothetical protein VTK56DRAFT_8435 [Thermocarpiscus australiensis]